jgi:hypothetical protein
MKHIDTLGKRGRLDDTHNLVSDVISLISGGIVPVNVLPRRLKTCSEVNFLISGGMEPVRLRLDSDLLTMQIHKSKE